MPGLRCSGTLWDGLWAGLALELKLELELENGDTTVPANPKNHYWLLQ